MLPSYRRAPKACACAYMRDGFVSRDVKKMKKIVHETFKMGGNHAMD